jgi:hypothetical protein
MLGVRIHSVAEFNKSIAKEAISSSAKSIEVCVCVNAERIEALSC